MNYFVSIEKTSYDLWQIELLIQSFKKLGIQDNLYIAIADTNQPVNVNFTSNIKQHKNKFLFPNINGVKKQFFCLASLVYENKLPLPFVTIHPDMVIVKDIPKYDIDFVFSSFDEDQNYKNEFKNIAINLTNRDTLPLIKPSAVYYIGENIQKSFFDILYKFSLVLDKFSGNDWLEKAIWYLSVTEYCNDKEITIGHQLFEQCLLNYDLFANFIHYKHGYPPYFHKKHFQYKEPCFLSLEESDPFKAICLVNSNESTKHIIDIVESYWKDHNIKK